MKEILRGSAIIFLFKVVGAIALFLIHILISRYYGAETLGIYSLIVALMTISTRVSRVGVDMYVVRIIPSLEGNHNQISLFLKQVFKIVLIFSFLISLLLFLLSDSINIYFFKSSDVSNYIILLALLTIPFTFFNLMPEILRSFHSIKLYSFFRNFSQNGLVLLLLSLNIYLNLNFDIVYILYFSLLLITIIFIYVMYKYLKKKNIYLNIRGKYNKKILKFSFPMFLTSSIIFLISNIDSFMISYYIDEYQVGLYSACIKLSFLLTFVLSAIDGFIAPKISKAYSNRKLNEIKMIYKSSLKIIVLTTMPIFLLFFIFPEFFLGLFGEEFKVAKITFMIISVAFVINALCGSIGYILNMTDNQNTFVKILLGSLVLNLILNAILIPKLGINGAAIATFISMSFWNIGGFLVLKRKRIL